MSIDTALASLWTSETSVSRAEFVCTAFFVAPCWLLTAAHACNGQPLWLRPHVGGNLAFPIREVVSHPEGLDLALIRIEAALNGVTVASFANDRQPPPDLRVHGYFEGALQVPIPTTALNFDGKARHYRMSEKQSVGYSGGPVVSGSKVWAVSTLHYSDPNTHIGCAVAVHQFNDWLKSRLALIRGQETSGVASPPIAERRYRDHDDPPASEARRPDDDLARHHAEMLTDQLSQTGAKLFYEALVRECRGSLRVSSTEVTPELLVERFRDCEETPEKIGGLFISVRKALLRAKCSASTVDVEVIEVAAAGLYFLCARRLVSLAANGAGQMLFRVPVSQQGDRIVCGVIANALFGGKLCIEADDGPLGIAPRFVYEVHVPGTGDLAFSDFERAAFCALFPLDQRVTHIRLDCGPLDQFSLADLKARIQDIRLVQEGTFALVIRRPIHHSDQCHSFARAYSAPVLLPSSEISDVLLGMDTPVLLAEIRELLKQFDRHTRPRGKPEQGEPSMSINLVNNGTLTGSFGANSPVQAGSGNIQNAAYDNNADLAAFKRLFEELRKDIEALPSGAARQQMLTHIAEVETGMKPGKDRNPGLIKNALDSIGKGAKFLEDGRKIIELSARAFDLVAPLIGLGA